RWTDVVADDWLVQPHVQGTAGATVFAGDSGDSGRQQAAREVRTRAEDELRRGDQANSGVDEKRKQGGVRPDGPRPKEPHVGQTIGFRRLLFLGPAAREIS